jgi:hypothetical protein
MGIIAGNAIRAIVMRRNAPNVRVERDSKIRCRRSHPFNQMIRIDSFDEQ